MKPGFVSHQNPIARPDIPTPDHKTKEASDTVFPRTVERYPRRAVSEIPDVFLPVSVSP
jgi:hypothetical protein